MQTETQGIEINSDHLAGYTATKVEEDPTRPSRKSYEVQGPRGSWSLYRCFDRGTRRHLDVLCVISNTTGSAATVRGVTHFSDKTGALIPINWK